MLMTSHLFFTSLRSNWNYLLKIQYLFKNAPRIVCSKFTCFVFGYTKPNSNYYFMLTGQWFSFSWTKKNDSLLFTLNEINWKTSTHTDEIHSYRIIKTSSSVHLNYWMSNHDNMILTCFSQIYSSITWKRLCFTGAMFIEGGQ